MLLCARVLWLALCGSRILRSKQPSGPRGATTEYVATQSCRTDRSRDRLPSKAIVPVRRPGLPDDATTAEPSMTLGACKAASSAILS